MAPIKAHRSHPPKWERDCYFSENATGNCDAGEGAVVAAGAFALQDTRIPSHGIGDGAPAKFFKPAHPGTGNTALPVAYAQEYTKAEPRQQTE